jgi:hypothetical protein
MRGRFWPGVSDRDDARMRPHELANAAGELLDFGLLGDLQCIVDLDPEVPDRAFKKGLLCCKPRPSAVRPEPTMPARSERVGTRLLSSQREGSSPELLLATSGHGRVRPEASISRRLVLESVKLRSTTEQPERRSTRAGDRYLSVNGPWEQRSVERYRLLSESRERRRRVRICTRPFVPVDHVAPRGGPDSLVVGGLYPFPGA